MILDMNGNLTTTVHKVCISNFTKDRFLSVSITGLRWTDNFNFASCFDSKQEALEFAERPYVHEFIDDVLEQYIWTDTRELVYENN
ncbi:MAG: hypothetical protein JXR27_02640 [Paludibacteraceae bacterium]|nr:hypothetical protein [Paludibacteraceae bacterium]